MHILIDANDMQGKGTKNKCNNNNYSAILIDANGALSHTHTRTLTHLVVHFAVNFYLSCTFAIARNFRSVFVCFFLSLRCVAYFAVGFTFCY